MRTATATKSAVLVFVATMLLAGCGSNSSASTSASTPDGASASAAADDFPSRSIELVNPFPPGGGHDAEGRLVVATAQNYMDVRMLLGSHPGGGGAVGATYVADAVPDGYTLLYGDPNTVVVIPITTEEATYTLDDFIPIAQTSSNHNLFIVRSDSPWDSLEDLVAAAKADPDRYTYGLIGIGGLDTHQFLQSSGVQMRAVPFEGGGDNFLALLAGDIDFAASYPAVAGAEIEAGNVRPLATSATERLEAYPDVPTFQELGYDVSWGTARIVFAPSQTPPEVVERLRDIFRQVAQDEALTSIMRRMGENPNYVDGPDVMERLQRDRESAEAIFGG